MKPSISFLLAFVFSQSTPVAWHLFPQRLLCLGIGSIFVSFITCLFWVRKGYNKEGKTIKEQIKLCQKNKEYLWRIASGISIAMFFGQVLQIKKPLWISIVVMSITQLEFKETLERMIHRFAGTLLGIIIFYLFVQILIPHQYAMIFILLLGYLSAFTTKYKYKQAINAVSAINAALVLLDTKEAIIDRILFLIAGILIVIAIYGISGFIQDCQRKPPKKELRTT